MAAEGGALKTCKVCSVKFQPLNSLVRVCSVPCALAEVERKKVKQFKAETKLRREAMKTHSAWIQETQQAFNRFIRARDRNLPCISCGRDTGAKRNAGHYLAVGSHPELRFNELNCHGQCEHCNTHLSGNLIDYRIGLIAKVGQHVVDWLEGPHKPLKPTIEELKWLKKFYTIRAKECAE